MRRQNSGHGWGGRSAPQPDRRGAVDWTEGIRRMELCVTDLNPAPPGVIVSVIRTKDNVGLRVARWRCGEACAGTVAIFPGRAEFIEKYFEVAAELRERSFDVVILDWRGQGGSDRLAAHPG